MLKKPVLLLCTIALLASLLLTSCNQLLLSDYDDLFDDEPTDNSTTGTTAEPDTATTASGETTVKPGETTVKPGETTVKPGETTVKPGETTVKPGETTVKPGETTVKPADPEPPVSGNQLIFYENFEKYGTVSDSAASVSALGWTVQNTDDGAYKDSTSKYSIREHNGSRQLYIENYTSSLSGNDSYIMILSSSQFGYLHTQNYTFQYDIEYADAADMKRYIALVTEYNGSYYNSFHFRNSGYGNNQCHASSSWYHFEAVGSNYAADTSSSSSSSIAYKLLGKYYNANTELFSGVSVSVRCVMDWKNGNSVYMRVNDKTSFSSGEWVLVSSYNPDGSASSYMRSDAGGAAVVLKTGGAQNGYIDNIIIWSGTGDEPADKSSPYLSSRTSGHNYITVDGREICSYCGKTRAESESGWLLSGIPVYEGGTLSQALYATGQGIDKNLPAAYESPMQLISGTSAEEFKSYCSSLASQGYKSEYTYSCDGNLYASYSSSSRRVYTYYTASTKTVRVIDDRVSDCSVADFGYTYTKKSGDKTVLYQYGVPMNEAGVNIANNDEKKIDCGMMYVIKLADNSVLIMDGGGYQQFDTAQIDGLMKFLSDITGAGTTGKIRIAGWYITHGHSDHMAGFGLFAKKYSSRLTLERVFFNFPSPYSPDAKFSGAKSNYNKLINYITTYFADDNPKFIKIHSGQIIKLADISISVLYTHEDIVDAKTAQTGISGDYNNSSSVIKINFDGKSLMFLGDINRPAMNILLENCSDTTLKSDIVQLGHHVINNLSELYHRVKAPVILVPQSPNGSVLNATRRASMTAAKTYLKNNMLFYASEGTTGLEIVGGTVTVTYTAPVDGGPYLTNWGW